MSLARRLKGTVYISDHEFHFTENLTKFDGSQAATVSSWMQPGHVTSAASSSSNIPDCGPAPSNLSHCEALVWSCEGMWAPCQPVLWEKQREGLTPRQPSISAPPNVKHSQEAEEKSLFQWGQVLLDVEKQRDWDGNGC